MEEEILYVIIVSLALGYNFGIRKWLERTIDQSFLKKYINYIIASAFITALFVFALSYFKLTLLSLFSSAVGGYAGTHIYEYFQKRADLANMKLYFKKERLNQRVQ